MTSSLICCGRTFLPWTVCWQDGKKWQFIALPVMLYTFISAKALFSTYSSYLMATTYLQSVNIAQTVYQSHIWDNPYKPCAPGVMHWQLHYLYMSMHVSSCLVAMHAIYFIVWWKRDFSTSIPSIILPSNTLLSLESNHSMPRVTLCDY